MAGPATAPVDLSVYRENPAGFVREVLGEQLWSKQAEIAQALMSRRRVAVPSCHAAGKSFLASRIVAWWLSCHPAGDAFVVTSAPTFAQVRAILWREVRRAHKKGKLPGKLNQTEWWLDDELVAFGRKPADLDPTAFQGIHARRVLVVFDEACGIPKPLWDAGDTLLTNDQSRFLAIGNPDDANAHFARVCRPGSGWTVIRIPAATTPNLSGEAIAPDTAPLLISPLWVAEKRLDWGEGSALWKAKIEAEFPDDGDDSLFPAAWIRAAAAADLPAATPVELGVDVARFGRDATILMLRAGGRARCVAALRGRDLMAVTGAVIEAIRSHKPEIVRIDDAGLGGGVSDRLAEIQRESGLPCRIVPVNVARPARNSERFANSRAEFFWGLRQRFQDQQIDIDAADEELHKQLSALTFCLDSRGRTKIIGKDDLRRQGISSPDRADALMLAFAGTGEDTLPRVRHF